MPDPKIAQLERELDGAKRTIDEHKRELKKLESKVERLERFAQQSAAKTGVPFIPG